MHSLKLDVVLERTNCCVNVHYHDGKLQQSAVRMMLVVT